MIEILQTGENTCQEDISLERAITLFQNEKYEQAFNIFALLYNQGNDKEYIMQVLRECSYEPNVKEMKHNYDANVTLLKKYPYFWDKDFCDYCDLPFQLFPASDEIYYVYHLEQDRFLGRYDAKTRHQMRYFFENLDQPIRVEDEDNLYNLTFLNDNVRKSEDIAKENHIYLYYNSLEVLERLMLTCDLKPILKQMKFVFLIGQENDDKYPLDFKEMFGIDYEKMKVKPIRTKEIQRLILNVENYTDAGHEFFVQLLDNHPNLLTYDYVMAHFPLMDATLDAYCNYIQRALSNPKTQIKDLMLWRSDEFQKYLENLDEKGADYHFKRYFSIFLNIIKRDHVKSRKDWMCAEFLALAEFIGRNLNQRIIPAIFFPFKYTLFPTGKFYDAMTDIRKEFQYCVEISNIRDPVVAVAGHLSGFFDLKIYHCLEDMMYWTMDINSENCKHRSQSNMEYFDRRALVRFEDLKLNPVQTWKQVCKYINIPWSDTLKHTTNFGEPTSSYIHSDISDYDPASLYKPRLKFLNYFDRMRLEILFYPYYTMFGYQPMYYDGTKYEDSHISELMKIPFKFEECFLEERSMDFYQKNQTSLKKCFEAQRMHLSAEAVEWVKFVYSNQLEPMKVLFPQGTLPNPLYENYTSLPPRDQLAPLWGEEDDIKGGE